MSEGKTGWGDTAKSVFVAVVSAAVISFGSIAVTHTLTVSVLQERLTVVAKDVAEHEQRIARLEETLAKVDVRVETIDRNTRIGANAARENGARIQDINKSLNRLIGYMDRKESFE